MPPNKKLSKLLLYFLQCTLIPTLMVLAVEHNSEPQLIIERVLETSSLGVGIAMVFADLRKYLQPEQGGCRISEEYLRKISSDTCHYWFGFSVDEILELSQAMEIPDPFKTREGYSFSSVEALCILLYRFRMDADIHDITSRFDRSSCAVSMVINDLLLFLDDTWSHLLGFDSDRLLSRQKIRAYAAAIHAAGAPTETVWGFIDCTIRRICRPSYLQRIAYSGYKHFHAMKYQGVVLPNGLFANLFGPFEGRRNDNAVLHDSGLKETCRKRAYTRDSEGREQYYQLFGDPAYVGISRELMSPYTGSRLSEDQQRFNAKMSHFRIEVEHAFAVALNQWPFLDHWKRHRVYSSPIGRYYRIGILLTNSMTCLRGRNQISDTFRCPPPTLEEYFHH